MGLQKIDAQQHIMGYGIHGDNGEFNIREDKLST
jgi:hypothetical protein